MSLVTQSDPARFERSAAFWLRAYPRWWRAERGGEVVAVLADLAPGATLLSWTTAAGIVVHGWAERWRAHPPVWPWIGYRLFRVTLEPQHRRWMQEDVDGVLFPWRVDWFAVLWFPITLTWQHGWPFAAAFVVMTNLARVGEAPSVRRRFRDRVLEPVAYSTRRADEVHVVWEPTPRLRPHALLVPMAVVSLVAAVVGVTAMLAMQRSVVALPYLLAVGMLVAAWSRWRLGRLRPVPQPHRTLVELSRTARRSVPAWCAMWVAVASLEVAGAWDLALYTPVMAIAGLLCAPTLLVGAAWASRRGGDLAGADVLRAVVSRRVRVDELRAFRYVGPDPDPARGRADAVGNGLSGSSLRRAT